MPEPSNETPQSKLQAVLKEITELESRGANLEPDGAKRFEELLHEGHALRGAIERQGQAGDLSKWARESAGMVPLATMGGTSMSGAAVEGMTPAGNAYFEMRDTPKGKTAVVAEESGEGSMSPAVRSVISTEAYARSFHEYLRRGDRRTSDTAMRTLQEGLDPSGGFLVPEDLQSKVISREPTPTRVAARVSTYNTSTDRITFPRINYSADDLYTTGMRVNVAPLAA